MKDQYDADSLRRYLRELDEKTFKEWLDSSIRKALQSTQPQQPEFLSEEEAQEFLKVKRTTLYQLRMNGLPFIKLGSKTIYRRTEILEWVEQHAHEKF